MICPYCKEEMRKDERGYHVCGKCLGEFWPGEQQQERGEYQKRQIKYDVSSPEALIFGLAESTYGINYKPPLPPGEPTFKGGSKSGKRRKKKPKIQMANINYL
jgi:hypothetical protein